LQHFVAREFRKYQPNHKYSAEQWQLAQDLNWIKNNSGGKERGSIELAHAFSPPPQDSEKDDNREATKYRGS
jgi:hypothetical protein